VCSDMATEPPDDLPTQRALIARLRDPSLYPAPVASVSLQETHISWVLLTGQCAYKIKKAVNLGFLDFTTLPARRHFCEQELRLNRRLAPAIYLDVVAITGTVGKPVIGGGGPILEYAVRMREFPQDDLASRVLARGALTAAHIDALAADVAAFHGRVEVARPDSSFGVPEDILGVALQNFAQILPLASDAPERADLDALHDWTQREFAACRPVFLQRRQDGFIRECHGDLHLGNIALVDGRITIFDCIEFNDHLRWIDVISEVAFVVMDLHDRGSAALAHRFLNAYLELTGDYAGLAVLRFYLAYRAMVRAMVTRLRVSQVEPGAAQAALLAEYRGYVALAKGYAEAPRPAIVITHGLAGCGKTTSSQALLELTGAVRVRSDVERKRMHGIGVLDRTGSGIASGLYAAEATRETYLRVRSAAHGIAAAGRIAIVDATFLQRWQRDLFRQLAADLGLPFVIVDFVAREATLRERIALRAEHGGDASDADLAVLEHQLRTQVPLAPDEQPFVVAHDAEVTLDRARDVESWREVLARLGLSGPATGNARPGLPQAADPGLEAKVAFLSQPQAYPESTDHVDRIETHMSWVFLTDHHAWKLKKPVHHSYLDFSTEAARRMYCAEEVRLNRRLARDVYLGTVPLTLTADGQLRLAPDGTVVDWLVKMRRLPAGRMLDVAIRTHCVRSEDIRNVVGALCRLYRECAPVAISAAGYRQGLAERIAENGRELLAPDYALPADLVEHICRGQRAYLDQQSALFDQRVRAGRIVEGHGDLRPEHVCLEPQPQIIDCLEFSRAFRILDAADELAFLALECERLGAPELRSAILGTYAELSGDDPPDTLVHFYQSYRACLRAKIAIWHLKERALRDLPKWPAQARDYLRLAGEHLGQCG